MNFIAVKKHLIFMIFIMSISTMGHANGALAPRGIFGLPAQLFKASQHFFSLGFIVPKLKPSFKLENPPSYRPVEFNSDSTLTLSDRRAQVFPWEEYQNLKEQISRLSLAQACRLVSLEREYERLSIQLDFEPPVEQTNTQTQTQSYFVPGILTAGCGTSAEVEARVSAQEAARQGKIENAIEEAKKGRLDLSRIPLTLEELATLFRDFPEDVRRGLGFINISGCHLRGTLPDLKDFLGLKTLLAEDNQLSGINGLPSSIKKLKIRSNQFTEIPSAVLALGQLDILDVGENQIGEYPEAAANKGIRILELDGNPFGPVPLRVSPPIEIVEGILFLGDTRHLDGLALPRLGINTILNCSKDRQAIDLEADAKSVNDSIEQYGAIIVEHVQGRSRPIAVVIAYLMLYPKMTLWDAAQLIKIQYPHACLNKKLIQQLIDLEFKLKPDTDREELTESLSIIFKERE